MRTTELSSATVRCPSRLAFGLANLSLTYGGVDGGVGVSCEHPNWSVNVSRAQGQGVHFVAFPCNDVANAAVHLQERLEAKFRTRLAFKISNGIPSHHGLGSKTSLLAGMYLATCALLKKEPHTHELGQLTRRGGTSGVGCSVALNGGWVWDLGHRTTQKCDLLPSRFSSADPPRSIRLDVPNNISIVHFSLGGVGVSGQNEKLFFEKNTPIPISETRELLAIIAGGLIPSLYHGEIRDINNQINIMQKIGLKRREWDIQSPILHEFVRAWQDIDHDHSIGLSSTGPTLYILTDNPQKIAQKVELASEGRANIVQTNSDCQWGRRVELNYD